MLFCNAEENMTLLLIVFKIHQERLIAPSQYFRANLKLAEGLLAMWFGFLQLPPAVSTSQLPTSPHIQFCASSVRVGMDSTFKHCSWGLNRGAVFRFCLRSTNQDPGNKKAKQQVINNFRRKGKKQQTPPKFTLPELHQQKHFSQQPFKKMTLIHKHHRQ